MQITPPICACQIRVPVCTHTHTHPSTHTHTHTRTHACVHACTHVERAKAKERWYVLAFAGEADGGLFAVIIQGSRISPDCLFIYLFIFTTYCIVLYCTVLYCIVFLWYFYVLGMPVLNHSLHTIHTHEPRTANREPHTHTHGDWQPGPAPRLEGFAAYLGVLGSIRSSQGSAQHAIRGPEKERLGSVTAVSKTRFVFRLNIFGRCTVRMRMGPLCRKLW